MILKGYRIDWSLILDYINRVYLRQHNVRAKRIFYFLVTEACPFVLTTMHPPSVCASRVGAAVA